MRISVGTRKFCRCVAKEWAQSVYMPLVTIIAAAILIVSAYLTMPIWAGGVGTAGGIVGGLFGAAIGLLVGVTVWIGDVIAGGVAWVLARSGEAVIVITVMITLGSIVWFTVDRACWTCVRRIDDYEQRQRFEKLTDNVGNLSMVTMSLLLICGALLVGAWILQYIPANPAAAGSNGLLAICGCILYFFVGLFVIFGAYGSSESRKEWVKAHPEANTGSVSDSR